MLTNSYWPGQTSHGDVLVREAIGGTGAVAGWNDKSRRELLTKAAAYEVVRQYMMDRLESGVAKCNAGASGAVDDWVRAPVWIQGPLDSALPRLSLR